MNIVSLKEFRSLPEGTVYMKFNPHVFEELCIKGETWEHDFVMTYITQEIDAKDSGECGAILETAMQDSQYSIKMDFDCYGRDGLFEEKQLFAVYEKQDVEGLINALQGCLVTGYN